jgi:hypothetical protein
VVVDADQDHVGWLHGAYRTDVPARAEVEDAFAHWWKVGNVDEDWAAWVDLYVPDVFYIDHFWGPLNGHRELDLWIHAVMKGVPEIYAALDWYTIDDATVVFHYQNRRDNPSPEGPPYWDFAGLSVLRYAGDGRWASEEDFWDVNGARRTSKDYAAACERAGLTDPLQRMTRRHWPAAPAWARTDAAPAPTWLARPELPAITRPSQLAALVAGGA